VGNDDPCCDVHWARMSAGGRQRFLAPNGVPIADGTVVVGALA